MFYTLFFSSIIRNLISLKRGKIMPSIWCPKCQTNKHRDAKCPKCGFIEEDNSKTYEVPKNKPVRILNGNKKMKTDFGKYKMNFIELGKNPILVGAVLVIALSVGYLAFAKYQENKKYDKWMKAMVGTSDPDKALEVWKKQLEQAEKNMDKVMLESAKQQKELVNKILIDNTKK